MFEMFFIFYPKINKNSNENADNNLKSKPNFLNNGPKQNDNANNNISLFKPHYQNNELQKESLLQLERDMNEDEFFPVLFPNNMKADEFINHKNIVNLTDINENNLKNFSKKQNFIKNNNNSNATKGVSFV